MESELILEFRRSLEWNNLTRRINRIDALKVYKAILRVRPSDCLYNYGQRKFGFIMNNKRYDIDGDNVSITVIG